MPLYAEIDKSTCNWQRTIRRYSNSVEHLLMCRLRAQSLRCGYSLVEGERHTTAVRDFESNLESTSRVQTACIQRGSKRLCVCQCTMFEETHQPQATSRPTNQAAVAVNGRKEPCTCTYDCWVWLLHCRACAGPRLHMPAELLQHVDSMNHTSPTDAKKP